MEKKFSRLTFETVRVVLQVLKQRNMTVVSNEIGITQPAVTFHVKKFESVVGRKIINRVGNNLVVSKEAYELIDICEELLSVGNELAFFTAKKWDRRKLMGICQDVFAGITAQDRGNLEMIQKYQPVVDHSLSLNERYNAGELHAVVRAIYPTEMPPEFVIDVPFRWVASRKLPQGKKEHLPIILEARKSAYSALARNFLDKADIDYQVMAEANSFEALRTLVERGVGYALVPAFRTGFLDVEPEVAEQSLQGRVRGAYGLFYRSREISLGEATDMFDEVSAALGG
jgi:DNA-binding transcriptional LysR family regulator